MHGPALPAAVILLNKRTACIKVPLDVYPRTLRPWDHQLSVLNRIPGLSLSPAKHYSPLVSNKILVLRSAIFSY